MMSGTAGAEGNTRDETIIKQEEDTRFCSLPELSATRIGNVNGGLNQTQQNSCSSPSTTILYSPTTTAVSSDVSNIA